MYAVIFEIDTSLLNEAYHESEYKKVQAFMEIRGFILQQKNVYFGTKEIDAVKCVHTVEELAVFSPWLSTCLVAIKMLRIEESIDLMPLVIGEKPTLKNN